MHLLGISLLPVLVAALSTMAVGFLWYSPMLFARPWTILMGYDPDDKAKLAEMQKSAGPSYGLSLVASFVSAVVLAKVIQLAGVRAAFPGMEVGLVVWIGFVTTVQLTNSLFMRQPAKLYFINTGYQLVCYLVMGAILGAWQG